MSRLKALFQKGFMRLTGGREFTILATDEVVITRADWNELCSSYVEKNKDKDCIFLDIPLLYESHLEYLCDEIIVVYLNEKKQVQRLMTRDHIDEKYAYTIMNNQISSLKKKEMADIVFDNNQEVEDLYKQIDEFIERISHERIINE